MGYFFEEDSKKYIKICEEGHGCVYDINWEDLSKEMNKDYPKYMKIFAKIKEPQKEKLDFVEVRGKKRKIFIINEE